MKNTIPQYTFYKTKYGNELLVDVVELKYIKKFLSASSVHSLSYYDITFITEGEGFFSIDNQTCEAAPGDVFFSKPGEIRNWDTLHISNGYALIFEDTFLSSFFKDSLFVQHLSFFSPERSACKLQLPAGLYHRMLQLLHDIKTEIDTQQHDIHVLRALLYETLMLLNRTYRNTYSTEVTITEASIPHLSKFIELVSTHLMKQHSVQFYANKLCITPNYLNEIVTSATSISAKQYIRNKVMDEAKRQLAYTNLPISEIAFNLNYSTVSYFVRSFRQCTGQTPLAYRRTHKP